LEDESGSFIGGNAYILRSMTKKEKKTSALSPPPEIILATPMQLHQIIEKLETYLASVISNLSIFTKFLKSI